MSTQVHAITAIVDGFRNSADLCGTLERQRVYVRSLNQLEAGRQARATGSGNSRYSFDRTALAGENRNFRRTKKVVRNVQVAALAVAVITSMPRPLTMSDMTTALTMRPTRPKSGIVPNSSAREWE